MFRWRDVTEGRLSRNSTSNQSHTPEDMRRENVIKLGDFRIDIVDRTATVRAQRLPLTSRQFDLLVFSLRNIRYG